MQLHKTIKLPDTLKRLNNNKRIKRLRYNNLKELRLMKPKPKKRLESTQLLLESEERLLTTQ